MTASRASLLNLPDHIRFEIIKYVGLVRKCPINIGQELVRLLRLSRRKFGPCKIARCTHTTNGEEYLNEELVHLLDESRYDNGLVSDDDPAVKQKRHTFSNGQARFAFALVNEEVLPCVEPRLPLELLFVCRQLHEEAIDVLYGENTFILDCLEKEAVRDIVNLSYRAKLLLKTIHILFGHTSVFSGHMAGRYLKKLELTFLAAEQLWGVVFERLFPALKPHEVNLSLACFVPDLETLRAFVNPLWTLPPLRQIRVDFGDYIWEFAERRKVDHLLASVCNDLVRPEYQRLDDVGSFPFFHLSKSIRLMILERSGLIIHPDKTNTAFVPLDPHEPSAFLSQSCCGTCDEVFGCCRCNRGGTYSSSCSCLPIPTALFTTSKQMRAEAMEVFYPRNHFVVSGSARRLLAVLSRIPPDRMRLYKRISIDALVTPRFDEYGDWKRVFGLLEERPGGLKREIKVIVSPRRFWDRGERLALRRFRNLARNFKFKRLEVLHRSR